MVVTDEGFGEELTEVAKAYYGYLEGSGLEVTVFEVGFVVKRLSCVNGVNLERREVGGSGRVRQDRERQREGNEAGEGEEREGLGGIERSCGRE